MGHEVWKAIEGYEGLYEVSDMGNVRSLRNNIVLSGGNSRGYRVVVLSVNGNKKTFAIHRLVAKTFCEGYAEGFVVNHIDGIRDNNNKNNLEWTTQAGNVRNMMDRGAHGYNKGLHLEILRRERYVECIGCDGNVLAVFPSMASAERALGIPRSRIHGVCKNGKTYNGFKWRKITR